MKQLIKTGLLFFYRHKLAKCEEGKEDWHGHLEATTACGKLWMNGGSDKVHKTIE